MISRSSQATSSVLKARPLQNAVAHDARRSIASKAEPSTAPSNARTSRTMHTTRPTPQAVESTSFNMRTGMPLSSWDPDMPHPWGSRRQKLTADHYDNVVPAYYIERRRQRDDISERKEVEGGLMAQLSAGILSEGIAAQTRVREEKIPVELLEADGTVRFASGFEPPTVASDFHPVVAARKPEDGTCDVMTSAKVSWDEVLSPATNLHKGKVGGSFV
ncbi:hypothetical protein BDY19DRAFT_971709 [Irpex rosettiformis]|uniref:Uncharacterized protein n=1 Tax=Irpex rosettiformis TaxID=378272 RepID=A0ACB8TR50_9APHY|nr:hypothetical protein BDY19DRAFT_971709 [Irpex rosettiformis]